LPPSASEASAGVASSGTIVRVRASQAAELSDFSSKCFDQTYGPFCRAADVDAHIAEWLSPSAWLTVLTDPTAWVFALTIDDQWAAYAHVRLHGLPEGVTPIVAAPANGALRLLTPVEICRFYVSRKWHGQGVAATLMSAVMSHATSQGADSLWLSSWQENGRANAFYEKWGFEHVGTGTFLMGEDLQHDYLLQRALPNSTGLQ
jgi:ribosomal protein S18 acetylase RimI-like enzyme